MCRLIGAMFSLDASGQIGKSVVYSKWRGIQYARAYAIPANPNSPDQILIRDVIQQATQAWATSATISPTTIDAAYKLAYNTAAEGQGFSGFNMFVRDSVKKNYDVNDTPKFDGTLVLPTEPGDTA